MIGTEHQPSPAASSLGPRFVAVALLLVLGVAAVYGQTWDHGFINYDDDVYITANPVVTRGFSSRTAAEIFGVMAANWHPLTWVSHIVDWSLFGAWAGGHHLTSAALHAANAVLLCGVLAAMTGAFWRSAAVAAIFALHPQRVESVAWAAERKDVLSAFFWLATMGAYLRQVRRPALGRRFAVIGLFTLGLAAKPMLVTLPFVLILLDWWPLGRVRSAGGLRPPRPGSGSWFALVLEKAPLFALSFAASLLTFWAQTTSVVPMVSPAWETRLANAVVSYARYLYSFVWPEDLAFLYPYPRSGVPATELAAAAAVLAAITAAMLIAGRRRPWLPVGWLWYLGTLVPVIGLVQLGGQARSDRYTYLTTIGITFALVWVVGELAPRRRPARLALAAAFFGVLAALGWSAAAYARVWRDSLTLMEYTVRATKGNFIVLNNLGLALSDAGRVTEAVPVLREAARIDPGHCNAHYNLGNALLQLGRDREALDPLSTALSCYLRGGHRQDYIADTHVSLGALALRLQNPAEAERQYRAAIAIRSSVPALIGLRAALSRRRGAVHPPAARTP